MDNTIDTNVNDQELVKLRLDGFMKSYVDRNVYPEPTPEEVEKQLEKKFKYVRKLTEHLKPFSPATEEAYDEYLADIRVHLCSANTCVDVLKLSLHNVAHEKFRVRVLETTGKTVLEYANNLAKRLFKRSQLKHALEKKVFTMSRFRTSSEASLVFEKLLVHYAAVCRKHALPAIFSDDTLTQLCLGILPVKIEKELRKSNDIDVVSPEEVFSRAELLESVEDLEAEMVYPMTDESSDEEMMYEVHKGTTYRPPIKSKCTACGAKDEHYTKDCAYRKYTCRKCHEKGHIERACSNAVITKNNEPVSVTKATSKGVVHKDKNDTSTRGQAKKAINFGKDVIHHIEKRNDSSKKGYKEKREKEGKTYKAREEPLFGAMYEEAAVDSDTEDESNSEGESNVRRN